MELPLAKRTQINPKLLKAVVFLHLDLKLPVDVPGFMPLGACTGDVIIFARRTTKTDARSSHWYVASHGQGNES